MDVLLKSLTHHAAVALLILGVLWLLALVVIVRILLRQRKFEAKWRLLLSDSRGESLETLLYDHLRERMQLEGRVDSADDRLAALEAKIRGAVQHLGLVRYDAFPDVSGNQSFSLAAYDDNGDGAILTSIVGRNSCRVYCKPIVSGRSERDLSQEEQRAIRAARDGGVRTILSP